MGRILEELHRMKAKYSSDQWVGDQNAQDLCTYFQMYIDDIQEEFDEMLATDYAPTPALNPEYHQSLVDWYNSVGRGDRYSKAGVQAMYGYWPLVEHLYTDNDSH